MRLPRRAAAALLLVLLAAVALPLAAPRPAAAEPVTALYAFGDSLSDRGNLFALTGGLIPRPPYADGRFSNGPLWVEGLAAGLGLGPVRPSLLGGTDYAVGGATAAGGTPIDLAAQVGFYLLGPQAPSGALFTLWAGSNDLLNAIGGAPSTVPAVAAAAAQAVVDQAVRLVQQGGARELLMVTVPNLGLTPRLNGDPRASALGTAAAAAFNAALLADLAAEAARLAPADLRVLDTFSLLTAAVAAPAAFGFSNVTDACIGGSASAPGTPCADPGGYLFWDSIHPTAAGHAAIAAAALQAVPEPAGLAVLVVGFGALALAWRRPRRPAGAAAAA